MLSGDDLCFFQCGEPFFYEQLKFTWLVWVVIAVEFGGKIDAPSRDPIPLYDTLNLITQPAFPS